MYFVFSMFVLTPSSPTDQFLSHSSLPFNFLHPASRIPPPPFHSRQRRGGLRSEFLADFSLCGPEGNRIPVSAMRMPCITTILQAILRQGFERSALGVIH